MQAQTRIRRSPPTVFHVVADERNPYDPRPLTPDY